jgi:tetratricopeptide (TPR) repeat protein
MEGNMVWNGKAAARRDWAAHRLLPLVALLGLTMAAWADIPSRDCRKGKTPEDVVAACTSDLKQQAPAQNRAATLNARAKAYETLGMSDQAKADYDQAVELAPVFTTWFNRGQFLIDAGVFEAASDDLSKAIAFYDGQSPREHGDVTEAQYLEAHFQRGEALRRGGHYAEAVADYSLVIAAQPRNDVAFTQRAFAYSHLEQLDNDIADLTRVIALTGADAFTLYNRGLAYARKGDDAHALADFSDAIERAPSLATAYVARGSVLEQMGKRDKALADYHKAAQIDPRLESAAMALARLDAK